MTKFGFTETHDVDSSAVDTLSYNENTQELVVDWHNDLYKYDGVSKERFDKVLNASSVGREAQSIKREFGPGEYLGRFGNVAFMPEKVKATSVGDEPAPVESQEQTPEGTETAEVASDYFPLTVGRVEVGSYYTYTVDFEDENGIDKDYTPKGVSSVDEAVQAVEEIADMLDKDFTIKGVYVSFE